MSIHILSVLRATSTSGAAWVQIIHDGGTIWLPAQTFLQSRPKVIHLLASQGLHFAGRNEVESFFQHLGSAGSYGGAPPIDESGWQGNSFAMPDRWVFHPDGCKPKPVVFSARFHRPAYDGTVKEWKESIGSLIKGQSLPMFIVQAALAAPLRTAAGFKGDLLFEIIAQSRSDLALLAATAFSVTGFVSSSTSAGPIPFDQVLGNERSFRNDFADLLLVADQADLAMAPESAARRGIKLRELLTAFGDQASVSKRLMTVLLGSRSLVDLAGSETEIGHEVARRCICMKVSGDALFGVLDRLPSDINDATDFADRLNKGAQRQHGRVIGCFIDRLVQELATQPARLKAKVDGYVNDFVARCGVNRNDTDETQIATSFGLIYAAGALARGWQMLPPDWRCRSATLRCYRRLVKAPTVQLSFSDLLDDLATSQNTVHFGTGQEGPSAEEIAAANVFVRYTPEMRELLIRKQAISKIIPHWSTRRTMPEVRSARITDGAHLAPKRRLPGENSVRIDAFRLSP